MRRLPIYFLIDVSESMIGQPIECVQNGMSTIIRELRTDPHALESVYISTIAFAGKTRKLTSLVDLCSVYPPKLPIGGGTSLGKALEFLMQDLDTSVQKTTAEVKGDWKPIVFLFTDGNPTDNYKKAFERWGQRYRRHASLIVVLLGEQVNAGIFRELTENILMLHRTDTESFKKFFKWITASIQTTSQSVSTGKEEELHLAATPNETLSKIDLAKYQEPHIDKNVAAILAKCQTTKRYYLIKYQKHLTGSSMKETSTDLNYQLVGAYPVDDSYFELADNVQDSSRINTDLLTGFPTCPCCDNQYGFSHCSCGKIICTGNEDISKCPWCNTEGSFSDSLENINITRTKG